MTAAAAMARRGLLALAGAALLCAAAAAQEAAPRYALRPYQIAVAINTADADSVEVGEYYRRMRHIPAKNVVRVAIPGRPPALSAAAFAQLKLRIDAQLDSRVQAIVLVWTAPYAVECNSITAALTLGLDEQLCRQSCAPGKANPYFDAPSTLPYSDFGMRLTMLLPASPAARAKALIARGLGSDGSRPRGSAYLLTTADKARNSRAAHFPPSGRLAQAPLTIVNLHAEDIADKDDVMFYFTGAATVAKFETLRFLPGAIADHLTSYGGDLLGGSQMSSLRWLEAGATASYGTVSEPCNHPQKFPYPAVLLKHYLSGASAVEAYWKSVAWPSQGLFLGEPLAAPYRR